MSSAFRARQSLQNDRASCDALEFSTSELIPFDGPDSQHTDSQHTDSQHTDSRNTSAEQALTDHAENERTDAERANAEQTELHHTELERAETVRELKRLFSSHLRDSDRLKRPEGVPTGLPELDRFLIWGGLPKGALSLLRGELGTGATSLWIEAAARLTAQKRWVAWIHGHAPLSPLPLYQKGMNLDHLIALEVPTLAEDPKREKLLWTLQELMSCSLFDLIGCDLGEGQIKEHQLRKLQAQARESHVALTFILQQAQQRSPQMFAQAGLTHPAHRTDQAHQLHQVPNARFSARSSTRSSTRFSARPKSLHSRHSGFEANLKGLSLFSLIVSFEPKCLQVERALHRPVPHKIPRSVSYARFTLHTSDCISTGASEDSTTRALKPENSLPQPATESKLK